MRRVLYSTMASILLAGSLCVAGAAAQEGQPVKPSHLLEIVPKGRFSPQDRSAAARYLGDHLEDLPAAPKAAEEALNRTGRWTAELAPHGRSLPKRLEAELAPAPDGMLRILFNRTLLLVRAEDGRILDRVHPD